MRGTLEGYRLDQLLHQDAAVPLDWVCAYAFEESERDTVASEIGASLPKRHCHNDCHQLYGTCVLRRNSMLACAHHTQKTKKQTKKQTNKNKQLAYPSNRDSRGEASMTSPSFYLFYHVGERPVVGSSKQKV